MKNMVKFWLCRQVARLIVRYNAWKYGYSTAQNIDFSVGGGDSSGSTAFSRTGTENKASSYALPTDLASLIDGAIQQLSLDNSDPHNTLMTNLLSQDPTSYQGSTQLNNVINTTAESQPWYSNLLNQAQRDPYSTSYETGTQDAYLNRLNETLAGIDSSSHRTGTQHQALVKGQAVADATRDRSADLARQRGVDSGISLNSAGLLNGLKQFTGGQVIAGEQAANESVNQRVMQALQAGGQRTTRGVASAGANAQSATTRGTSNEVITNDTSGQGQQSNSNFTWGTGGGVGCCWIVSTSYNGYPNGMLPPFVRRGRDEHQTPEGYRGYRKMAQWLVPRMMRSKLWMAGVNAVMVRPITWYGAWLYKQTNHTGYRWGWLFKPVFHGWLKTWKKLGA